MDYGDDRNLAQLFWAMLWSMPTTYTQQQWHNGEHHSACRAKLVTGIARVQSHVWLCHDFSYWRTCSDVCYYYFLLSISCCPIPPAPSYPRLGQGIRNQMSESRKDPGNVGILS